MTKLLDISFWQGSFDFTKLKQAGYNHIILRAGYGTTKDSKFDEYVASCKNAGITITAVYWFIYATNEAEIKSNAQKCMEVIKPYNIPIVFADFEYDTVKKAASKGVNLGKNECTRFTITFCEEVKKNGYTPGYYANKDYYNNMYTSEIKNKGYIFWLAHYLSNYSIHEAPIPCDFFQYTDRGAVPGLSGKQFDTNICYTEKYLDYKAEKTEETPTVSPSEIIQRVINDAVDFAVNIANDNTHGYSQRVRSLYNIDTPKSFDCSSLVCTAYYYAFIKNGLTKQAEYLKANCSYTGNMMKMLNCGFEVVATNQTAHSQMKKGDIELNIIHHVAMAIDGDNIVHARSSEGTSDTIDNSGNEIRTQGWYRYSHGWDKRLRFTGKGIDFSNITSSTPSTPTKKSYLSLGDVGSEVKSLQQKLNKLGFTDANGNKLNEDGEFGSCTDYAIRSLQKKYNLEVDGKCGALTMAAIDKAITALSNNNAVSNLVGQAQAHLRNLVDAELPITNKLDYRTKLALRKAIQFGINCDYKANLKIDGVIGSASKAQFKKVALKKGNVGILVTAIEIVMMANGYDPKGVENPGKFGECLSNAVYSYQVAHNLSADKIVGYNTLMELCK